MPLSFEATRPEQIAELTDFLRLAFSAPEPAPFLQPELLRWKYFEARPDWSGPRSYVLRQDGRIIAHGCAWPVILRGGAGPEVTSARVIDWAASPAVPGAGVVLFRKMAALADTLLAVGGSEDTRALLPKMGFRHVGDLGVYALPLRPWAQFKDRGGHGAKDWLRLARNAGWRAMRSRASTSKAAVWSMQQIDCFEAAFPSPRPVERLNFLLRCPATEFSAYTLERGGMRAGGFILTRVRHQARIAALWIGSRSRGDLEAAYALAIDAARRDPDAYEVKAAASEDAARRAIEAAGMRKRGSEPVYVYDRNRKLEGAAPPALELLDGDECWLDAPDFPYET